MAITVAWATTKVIFIPLADMTFISATEYELDVNALHITLRNLEVSGGGPWATTHVHDVPRTLSGVLYARKIIIVGGYTITVEDAAVVVTLKNGDNNILDVFNHNTVSIRSSNSAGAIDLSEIRRILDNRMITDPADGKLKLYDDNDVLLQESLIFEDAAGGTPYAGGAINRRDKSVKV